MSQATPAPGARALPRRLALPALALLFTLLNALKPLHVDDTYYYFQARQAALHPFDPHGFLVFWHELPEPASNRVAPPVLAYWLAPAVRAFPDTPFLWKMWLLPFTAALVAALDFLLRRFAAGLEWPLLLLTLASPAFLPSTNLMLDVPALALALLAQVSFIRAGDAALDLRSSPERRIALSGLWAAAAGVIAGLAAQTKYTGLLAPASMLLYALVYRRLRLWLLAAAAAAAVFASWEVFTALQYGESHFVRHLFRRAEPVEAKLPLVIALSSVLGAVCPGLWLLSLAARGARERLIWRAVAVPPALPLLATAPAPLAFLTASFALIGASLLVNLYRVVRRLWSSSRGGEASAGRFLIFWLGLELAGHFVMSPFPAVRRVLGLVVVATLILGRVASSSCRSRRRRRLAWKAAAVSAGLGSLFWAVDVAEALAQKRAVEEAASWLRDRDPAGSGQAFFAGHWGFQYYAERAGLRPAIAGRFPSATALGAGDWLVVPSLRVDQQQIHVDPSRLEAAHEVRSSDPIPLATLPGFYVGDTPLRGLAGPRVTVDLYRATTSFVP